MNQTMQPSHSSHPRSSEHTQDRTALKHVSYNKDTSQICPSADHRDWLCPVCLQTASFPVQTNCGHLFCAPCLISYWRLGSWLDAISCPLCRQRVSVLCCLFGEGQSDRKEREVLGEITDYNKRYSGTPRRVTDYLCDTPLFLQLLARGLGAMGGLVCLFFLRVVLCCLGAMVSLSSAPLDTPSSLSSLLGVLDDLVVVFLLLTCVININQQMTPESGNSSAHTATQGVGLLSNSL
ncbi:E3 ubiquitin-protein ligase RNF170 isoform X1 [Salmo salar]|uniref:E3 ubiquitin-protein ligase RNF170 isoform X1 n=1 Tax=Salmo salar TaxID=8030 RepID=A0A1S3PB96_SALSA|nr:E3 ubiquitin-protein ligase RNF170 isoform X1 [Salmo salar]|eukprot:XP_014024837.1 PREDICTED: E3 ubiquitin-protein ligase RNF170-like [Salmo salar]